ncbi:MAG TPA: hypothetical protein VF993_06225 [Myxococcales bacterium]
MVENLQLGVLGALWSRGRSRLFTSEYRELLVSRTEEASYLRNPFFVSPLVGFAAAFFIFAVPDLVWLLRR